MTTTLSIFIPQLKKCIFDYKTETKIKKEQHSLVVISMINQT